MRARRGQQSLPEGVREFLTVSREGLGGSAGGLGGVGRPSQRTGRNREGWKGSGVPPRGPGG